MFNIITDLSPVAIVKGVARILIMSGTATIVNGIVESNLELESTSEKVSVGVASFAIGGMTADYAGQWTDDLIDEIANLFTSEPAESEVIEGEIVTNPEM